MSKKPEPIYKGRIVEISIEKKFFRVQSLTLQLLNRKYKNTTLRNDYPDHGIVSVLFESWIDEKPLEDIKVGQHVLIQRLYHEPGKSNTLYRRYRALEARRWSVNDAEIFHIEPEGPRTIIEDVPSKKSIRAQFSKRIETLKKCVKGKIQRIRGRKNHRRSEKSK